MIKNKNSNQGMFYYLGKKRINIFIIFLKIVPKMAQMCQNSGTVFPHSFYLFS
jgi:hypothetical protein